MHDRGLMILGDARSVGSRCCRCFRLRRGQRLTGSCVRVDLRWSFVRLQGRLQHNRRRHCRLNRSLHRRLFGRDSGLCDTALRDGNLERLPHVQHFGSLDVVIARQREKTDRITQEAVSKLAEGIAGPHGVERIFLVE